eukprot:GFKZ01015533.1.p1 GENE.GFKZ01015533.1~~GFKZ01015533.1.p1  ORF type:complete len:753 (-),score=118.44 GFKZ01015533.1:1497-3755(-)
MPVKEIDVGITETLGSHKPFRAVLKQQIHDFVVNEVLLSGDIAKLTKLPQATADTRLGKRANSDRQSPNGNTPSSSEATLDASKIPFDEIEALFAEQHAKTASNALRSLLSTNVDQLVLPVCNDKQKRTTIHQWVRNHIPLYMTDTVDIEEDGEKSQAIRLRKKATFPPWKRRKSDRNYAERHRDNTTRPPVNTTPHTASDSQQEPNSQTHSSPIQPNNQVDRSTVISFVLWKRNKDTNEALNALSKALRVPPSAFSYAGTKDKRAVTTQLVQIRGIPEHRLARANSLLARRDRRFPSIAVGNYTVLPKGSHRPLNLGDLRGNRFTIVLRDLHLSSPADEENINAAVDGLNAHGFVNYFGLQRFGTGVSGTHQTGFAILRGDFEDACRRILLPVMVVNDTPDGRDSLTPARRQLITALESFARKELSAQNLLKCLPKWMHIERAIASSFASDERRGVTKYDYKAAFSKLPRNLRRMYGHAVQSYIWNMMASERIRRHRPDDPSRMHAIEGDLIVVNDTGMGELSFDTEVREVTSEEERQKSIPVFRVVVPVVGSDVSVPTKAEYSKVATRIIEDEKMELKGNIVREFGMRGTYRFLLATPRDVEMRITSYVDSTEVLIPDATLPTDCSGRDQGRKYGEVDAKDKDPDRQSSERDVAVQGANVEPEEPPASSETVCANGAKAEVLTATDAINGSNPSASKKRALVIGFTLGRGEFATMLVRELTMMDSSKENQKDMQAQVNKNGMGASEMVAT